MRHKCIYITLSFLYSEHNKLFPAGALLCSQYSTIDILQQVNSPLLRFQNTVEQVKGTENVSFLILILDDCTIVCRCRLQRSHSILNHIQNLSPLVTLTQKYGSIRSRFEKYWITFFFYNVLDFYGQKSKKLHFGVHSSEGPQAQQHSCQVRLYTEDLGLRLGSDGCHRPPDDTVCGYTLLQSTRGYPRHGLPSQWLVIIYVLYLRPQV